MSLRWRMAAAKAEAATTALTVSNDDAVYHLQDFEGEPDEFRKVQDVVSLWD